MLTFSPITVIPSLATNIFDPFFQQPCSTSSSFSHSSNSNPSMALNETLKRSISTQTSFLPSIIDSRKDTVLLINAAIQLIQISDDFGEYLNSLQLKKQNSSKMSVFTKLFSFIKFVFVFFI